MYTRNGHTQTHTHTHTYTHTHTHTHTHSFWSQLLPRMVPLLYQQGGPIIAVQIENELGYFGQDMGVDEVHTYLHALHSMACTYLGHHVILYTADPPQGLRVGSLPDDSVLR